MKKILLFSLLTGLLQYPLALSSNSNVHAKEHKSVKQTNVLKYGHKLKKHIGNWPKGNLGQIPYIKQILDYMCAFDQKVRKEFLSDRQNGNEARWALLIKKMDGFHTEKMKEILVIYGWITISKFGSEYDSKAWLLVQHADHDPLFQAGVLFILSQLINKRETGKQSYAYLYDRVAQKFPQLGILQRYGTQATFKNDGSPEIKSFEGNQEDVERCRKEMELEPLGEYLAKLKETYKP